MIYNYTKKTDSIMIDEGYSIDELKRILKRHYLNNGKVPNYSESSKKAFVQVTIDSSKNGKQLKDLLLKITRSFDKIKVEVNDTIELRIFLGYFTKILPSPLPPNMINKFDEK